MSERDFVFFYANASPFSQWHKCRFVNTDGVSFTSAEQYMMWRKAKLFGDDKIAAAILATNDCAKIKALGRRVAGYDDATWERNRENIVILGNIYKFSQNPDLWAALRETKGKHLVEASPWDKIWGIGLDEATARATPSSKWPGSNLLGKCLDRARDRLIAHLAKDEGECKK